MTRDVLISSLGLWHYTFTLNNRMSSEHAESGADVRYTTSSQSADPQSALQSPGAGPSRPRTPSPPPVPPLDPLLDKDDEDADRELCAHEFVRY